MRLVCASDTHARHDRMTIPDGDVFIHAGDITRHGEHEDIAAFNAFLGRLPHRHKIVIAGNHDFPFEHEPEQARAQITNATYLEDSGVTIEGVKIWGSPWQPWFFDWAFNLRRGPDIRAKWDLIPKGIGILITHGPPMGILDRTVRGEHVGCEELVKAIARVRPKVHVFGHIHEAYGVEESGGTTYINASICDVRYRVANQPVVYDLPMGG